MHPLSRNPVRSTGGRHKATKSPWRTTVPLCPPPAWVSRSAVYFCLGFIRLLGCRQDVLHGLGVVRFIHGTEPRRRAPALLLRLVEPRTTCTLLVHLLPFYLSLGLLHVRPLSAPFFVGVLMYRRVSPPARTDRIQNDYDSVRPRTCQGPSAQFQSSVHRSGAKTHAERRTNDVPKRPASGGICASPCAAAGYAPIRAERSRAGGYICVGVWGIGYILVERIRLMRTLLSP
jgi:hypothetical protein